jgi:hypothetical protein
MLSRRFPVQKHTGINNACWTSHDLYPSAGLYSSLAIAQVCKPAYSRLNCIRFSDLLFVTKLPRCITRVQVDGSAQARGEECFPRDFVADGKVSNGSIFSTAPLSAVAHIVAERAAAQHAQQQLLQQSTTKPQTSLRARQSR